MVSRNSSILNGCRPFADRYSILNLAIAVALKAGMLGTPDCAFCAQVRQKLLFEDTARLYIKAAIDRPPLGTLLPNTLPVSACDTCLCPSQGTHV
jgi:hypothetical protein